MQLHSIHKAHVEAILIQLKSCQEFLELESQSEYQLQAAKKQVVQLSKIKIEELQPVDVPGLDTRFYPNLKLMMSVTKLALSKVGYLSHLLVRFQSVFLIIM